MKSLSATAGKRRAENRLRNFFLVPTSFDRWSLAAGDPAERAAIEGLFGLRP